MTPSVREVLSWYQGASPGVLTNLARMLNHGALKGSGKLAILPVDQGCEHGPVRAFAKAPQGLDPRYHFELAREAGFSAHAAPLGALEAGASEFAGDVPLILKLNHADSLSDIEPCPAFSATVDDALSLGCSAVGVTFYPGSDERNTMVEQIQEVVSEAKAVGLPTVVWAYARGANLSSEGETAIDTVAYAAHLACQLGAHIVKVKPPTAFIENETAATLYREQNIAIATLEERVRHVMSCSFGGRRLVLFSGGAALAEDALRAQTKAIASGGASGAIVGRNVFQRPRSEALRVAAEVMATFKQYAS